MPRRMRKTRKSISTLSCRTIRMCQTSKLFGACITQSRFMEISPTSFLRAVLQKGKRYEDCLRHGRWRVQTCGVSADLRHEQAIVRVDGSAPKRHVPQFRRFSCRTIWNRSQYRGCDNRDRFFDLEQHGGSTTTLYACHRSSAVV